jgi:hypothetical protein
MHTLTAPSLLIKSCSYSKHTSSSLKSAQVLSKMVTQQQLRDLIAAGQTIVRRTPRPAFALEFAWSILQHLPHLGDIYSPHIILTTSHRLHVLFHGAVCVIPQTFNHPGGRDIFEKCVCSAALSSWKPFVAL